MRDSNIEILLTPPFNQITISLLAAGFFEGKNQKNRLLSSSGLLLMGREPA